MESHITSKGESSVQCMQRKENKSCIKNPIGVIGFNGIFAIVFQVEYIR